MAFVLSKTYRWPVPIELSEDGDFKEFTFQVLFNRLSSERIRELLGGGDSVKDLTDEALCHELVAGWSEVEDDEGNAMPFSKAALGELLKIHPAPAKIVKAWLKSLWNETAEGNSQEPLSTGQPAA